MLGAKPDFTDGELMPECPCSQAQYEELSSLHKHNKKISPLPSLASAVCHFANLSEQLNELVALIPHSDQRLRPQRTKQYVLLSVLLCLLASGLVFFFLFPHSVLVDDNGIKVVKVTFNKQDSLVMLDVMATLKIRNSNFYPVAVTNLFSQVQYMKAVVGTYMTTNVSLIPPRSEHLVNFTVKAKLHLHGTCHPGAQHRDLHEDFCEDFIHWPHVPEHLGDTTLCGLWGEFHSCLEPAFSSPLAVPVEGS
ncbi:transmembrane protein [Cricetulus griseus]|uniref:Transmembrane protein n=1 Tax=Cricetulus griseus TaxID=10029 RepID=A0A061IJ67_CRIGR|nr:transmembrane protein [Cricetulus griseus]